MMGCDSCGVRQKTEALADLAGPANAGGEDRARVHAQLPGGPLAPSKAVPGCPGWWRTV